MSDQILVQNCTAKVLGPSYIEGESPQILRLIPGVNRVDRSLWEKVESSKFVKRYREHDLLVVLDDKTELSAMAVTRAISVVAGTLDRDILESWKHKETRKPVLDAIDRQMDTLDGSRPDEQEPERIAPASPLNLAGAGVDVSAPRTGNARRRR